jgi:hypothetical protein
MLCLANLKAFLKKLFISKLACLDVFLYRKPAALSLQNKLKLITYKLEKEKIVFILENLICFNFVIFNSSFFLC